MKKIVLFYIFSLQAFVSVFSQNTALLDSYKLNRTLTYEEAIRVYKTLDAKYPGAALFSGGLTDIGKPLHLFVISSDGDFDPVSLKKKGKTIFFINNAIHPGEPDGVDASVKFANELLSNKAMDSLLKKVVICIIPVFNIDGALNRSCCSRANQNGPEEYGFRGNARNLDLNRDFIKADSKNTRSFYSFFRKWDPDVFADTHVSDGADYQYTMTLISTQHNKLVPVVGTYIKEKMTPGLADLMKSMGTEICPYVTTHGETPDSGIEGFLETPRFASGYAALFNTFAFVYETHMLKPFKDRVEATYKMLLATLIYTNTHAAEIIKIRKEASLEVSKKIEFPLQWQLDTTGFEMISFKGYEAKYKKSEVTGFQRLYYDRNMPYEKPIKFFDKYNVTKSVDRPDYYIIPQAWPEIIERFKLNNVKMNALKNDTSIMVQCYYIVNYESGNHPYEGHFVHKNTSCRKEKKIVEFYKGDYLVPVNQPANRYIVESLEPEGPDSFFAWGFFDAVLQQKEWFSDYVFEEIGSEILAKDNLLKIAFEKMKLTDKTFAADPWAQLSYVYQHSAYFEKTYNRYPVFRINW